jgi:LysM domain
MTARWRAIAGLLATTAAVAAAIVVLRSTAVVDDGQPASAAFEGLRRGALGVAWYLLATTGLGALARGLRAATLVRALDAITIAPLRRSLRAALGAGLAGVLTLSAPAVAAGGDDPPIVTLHRLPQATTTTVTWATPTTTPPPEPPPSAPPASSWRVRPGDCFWTIAHSVLHTRLGRPVADAEIVPYWRALIEANRARLRDPTNPDLIFPDQTLVLP